MRKSLLRYYTLGFSLLVVFALMTSGAAAQTYCTTGLYSTGCSDDDYIQSFSTTGGVSNITNNNTGCTGGGYNYYSTMKHAGIQGTVVNFSFTNTPDFSEGYKIWVDYNDDGTFDPATEQVYASVGTVGLGVTVTGSFTIPFTATPGMKRLRIRAVYNNTTFGPCTVHTWGEIEDYDFEVIASTPCSGTPTAGTATSSASTVCLGMPFSLNLSGTTMASGLTYQWQISTDNITWTDIPAATESNLTTSQVASNYYRAVVTCTSSGGGSANSTSVFVNTPPAVSGTFIINSANPTNTTTGTFQTFNDAYDYIKCGINGPVIFNVVSGSGPYNEQLVMTEVPGASATNTVTFNGNGATITYLSTTSTQRAVIKLDGADYIHFNTLVITATGTTTTQYGFGVQLLNDANYNSVDSSVININTSSTSTNYAGIVMSNSHTSATTTGATNSDFNVFSNNTINGGYYGITQVGSSTAANGNNHYLNNDVRDFYLYGMYVNGSFNSLIHDNTFSRPTRTTVSTFNGIYFTGLSAKASVSRNRITNPFGGAPTSTSAFTGITFTGVDALTGLDNVVTNNLIYNLTGNGDVTGINNTSSDNVHFYHNTLSMDGAAATATASNYTRGFYQTTTAAGIIFKNNLITITRGGPGKKHALYFNTVASAIESDYNNLYLAAPGGNDFTGYYNAIDRATLADWRTATTQDMNSIAINPLYQDIATGNYKPTNSGMDNKGTPVGVLEDIELSPRSTTAPDIGAYEFAPGVCVSPPTPGTATVSQTPVCVNTSVSLSVTGNTIGLGQTYQWQTSTTAGGTYTNIGNVLPNADTVINASATLYYRVAVTCGANTTYSTPVLLTVTPALPAGTYTIGGPAGPTNYPNFTAVKAALECGIDGPVVFNVVPNSGPYLEQFVLGEINGSSATNTVTFNGNGNTLKFSSSDGNERAVIKLNGTDHFRFDSLIIDATGAGTYGWGVQLMNDADSNHFTRNTVVTSTTSTSTNYAGIVMSASHTSATGTGSTLSDGNLFEGNTVIGGYYGITQVASTTEYVKNNRYINNTVRDFYFYGMYNYGTENTLIEGNHISRPTRTTISTFYGIYMTNDHFNALVTRNTITNPAGGVPSSTSAFYGIYFTGVDATASNKNIVSNNKIYNINNHSDQYGLYNSSSDYVSYLHNTVSFDYTDGTFPAIDWSRGFYQITTATGIEFKNNLISITRTGLGSRHAMYLATSATTIDANYNNYYVNGTGGTNYIGYNGTNHATLASWRTATGLDANSLSTDPVYTDLATGNLEPRSVVLDNKGTPVGVLVDIELETRSTTTPDIGAYEFTIPPCSAPPTPGAATAVPNTGICMGTPIELNLTGASFGSGQTYQWQTSATAGGTYTNLGNVLLFPDTLIQASGTLYYRAAVTCGGQTAFSTPVLVTMNPPFQGGIYTIDNSLPTNIPSGNNFNNFTDAVAALNCGITSTVIFKVKPGTTSGVYNEQISIPPVAGTGPTVRVIFESDNGIPSSATLTYGGATAAMNYTLKLDGSSYITFKNMTITATGATYGRVIEMANEASEDSLYNLVITAPVSTTTTVNTAGIYSTNLRGTNNLIKANSITNGTAGIYLTSATASPHINTLIDSNHVTDHRYYGIYVGNSERIIIRNNTVTHASPKNSTSYAMYLTNNDSAYQVVRNRIDISDMTGTTYGLYMTGNAANKIERARVANNEIYAHTGNTSTLYGMYQSSSFDNNTVNNVISISTSGTSAYGLYSTGGGGNNYHNNTVWNSSTGTGTTTNVAAYFTGSSGEPMDIRNNIFYHTGAGFAMYISNPSFVYSDYNMLYAAGANLVRGGTTSYPTLQAWRDAAFWDMNSIVYEPALTSTSNLHPDIADPDVWAIHGRGVQIVGNDYDHNNNPRPVTLQAGVPDLGAYEFVPTSVPVALTAIPPVPAAGTTQIFMLGTDTVTKITWKTTVPTDITMRRYSGVVPPGLAPSAKYMYFYTDVDIPGTNNHNFDIKEYYIDPWRGFIDNESIIKLGRTDAANTWIVDVLSTIDSVNNHMTRNGLTFMDKFTGLTDGTVPPPPPPPFYLTQYDTSNRGKKFWVGYAFSYDFYSGGNNQEMVLYLSTGAQAANVTVKVKGTNWVKTYAIPANTTITSDLLPKTGIYDSRLAGEGFYSRGISIESDTAITAYAHIYYSTNSGATMLLPVGTYGYEYYTLNNRQNYTTVNSHTSFFVVADRDNTVVEITPSKPTFGGRPAGVPFRVTLNAGDAYQVLGAYISGADGHDLTGSLIKSVPNSDGKCYPVAVFAGSTRTALGCGTSTGSSGDVIFQQVFPSQAWGKRYLTAPTSNSSSASSLMTNIYRVMIKDPTTAVTVNGLPITSPLIENRYYQFESNTADDISANRPIMVAQYMSSTGACPNTGGNGDPEMFYLSPVEQAIKYAGFYRNDEYDIDQNYLTIVIPTGGLPSLTIDGSNIFDHTYPHTSPGYTVVVKRWNGGSGQSLVQSDSAFTGIVYGLGSVESYGYNVGTLVKNLTGTPSFSNTFGSGGASQYTCRKTPFRFTLMIPVKPVVLVWKFSQVANLSPNTDVTQNNPVPVDSTLINNQWYYKYTLAADYVINTTGVILVPITVTHPLYEGCNNTAEITLPITVLPAPVVDFTVNFSGCIGEVAQFMGTGATSNGVPMSTWEYNFGDGTTAPTQNASKTWTTAGTYNVTLRSIAEDGCIGDTTKPVTVNPRPTVLVTNDSLVVCPAASATWSITTPVAGTTYNWYDAQTAGTLAGTGTSFTALNITGPTTFWVEAIQAGCVSTSRTPVYATTAPVLTNPVVFVDSVNVGANTILFQWNAVANANSYQVSVDNGPWISPSSGNTGLSHLVTGLQPLQFVTLKVRALGGCEDKESVPLTARTRPDQIFVPNSFSPNGDGINDILKVYSYVIKDMRFMVFNQWGEKVYETGDLNGGWDGKFKGKVQPSGVYMYVLRANTKDGKVVERKGSINLIR